MVISDPSAQARSSLHDRWEHAMRAFTSSRAARRRPKVSVSPLFGVAPTKTDAERIAMLEQDVRELPVHVAPGHAHGEGRRRAVADAQHHPRGRGAMRVRDKRFAGERRTAVRSDVNLSGSRDGVAVEVADLSLSGAHVIAARDTRRQAWARWCSR